MLSSPAISESAIEVPARDLSATSESRVPTTATTTTTATSTSLASSTLQPATTLSKPVSFTPTPTQPVSFSQTMKPVSFKPLGGGLVRGIQIKAPISMSLSSNASSSNSTPPKAISAAFGDSEVIRKRRENVLQWKLEREATKKAEEQAKVSDTNGSIADDANSAVTTPSKPWSWDNDDDEDGITPSAVKKDASGDVVMADDSEQGQENADQDSTAMDEDEVDPLDAFMVDVTAEVKELEQKEQKRDTKLSKVLAKAAGEDAENGKKPESMVDEDEDEDPAESSEEEDILAMAARRIKRKDIPAVDHSKMNYEQFRKNFYLEPPEMADMTPEEVHSLRLELDGIKIRGADCPKPIRKWTQAGLPAGCIQVIKDKLNYAAPTSIQCQAIPAIMSGRDVIAVAKTGSGKTIAFILPMLRHIKDQRPLENMEGPIAIIMTPTRELAVQIHKECKNFLKVLNLRAVCAYGGSPIKDQIAELKRGAEIIVCTPGRLIDLLCANSGRVTNLRRTTFMVMDEADRMFDMGFEPQMEALARKLLKRPLEITVGARSVVGEDITQIVEVRSEESRYNRLLEILGKAFHDDPESRILIFVSRQEGADTLLTKLIRSGHVSMSIHGGKDQVDRDAAISDFKAGVCQILIATSVAARGLDVKKLGIVINFDCPNHMEDYVHRVGRTGRAGNKGIAYTFITPDQERFAPDIAKALTNSSTPVPADLQALVDSFHEKVKSGDAKQNASGFGGKGLEKLEKERDKVMAIQKKTYGGGDDEEGSDGEGDGEGREFVVETKQVTPGITATKAAANHAASDDVDNKAAVTTESGSTASGTAPSGTTAAPGDLAESLRLAMEAANRLNQTLGGGAGKQRALEVINNLNKSRLGGTDGAAASNAGGSGGGQGSGHGRDSGFALEIEVNDFPQRARLMVTQKMMINQISEHSGAAITTRGIFVEEGKQPPPGERKLYLFVEGDSQYVVDKANAEIRRILEEETNNAIARGITGRGGGGGGGGGGGRSGGRFIM
ncbi:pre-mRNA processing RNA-helicase [Gryganskiella cystojenkinii]|nr:pre-mRNA processing RNA-helicase [Gryganskiella cystojenkinii]